MRPAVRRSLIGVGVAIFVVYVIGTIVFSNRCYPNTRVFGEDVSLREAGSVASVIEDHVSGWKCDVMSDGLAIDVTLGGDDVGLVVDSARGAAAVMNVQHGWAWPYEIFQSRELSPDVKATVDEGRLREMLAGPVGKANSDRKSCSDARLRWSGSKFVIEPEVDGTAFDLDKVVARCAEEVRSLSERVVIGEECIDQPSVRADSERLKSSCDRANVIADKGISLTVDDMEVAKVDGSACSSWLSSGEDGSLGVDDAACREWCRGPLAKRLDSVGSERTYRGPDGSPVTVKGGTYGWVVDGDLLADQLVVAVRDGTESLVVPFRSQAARWAPGDADWPSRYIDVDLSRQHVWLMDGGSVIMDSDCVSGNPSTNHGTPTGVYSLYAHISPMTLVGTDDDGDGQPDYRSDVTYWMPFLAGYGLHDASWRTSFGGEIYRGDGSHGCVNLPADFARNLYGEVSEGTVVVVHE